jgi:hypothetical protein
MKKHIQMTIKAARKNWEIFKLPKEEVLQILDEMEAEGKTLVPPEGCDNFDQQKGCQGHTDKVIDLLKEGTMLPAPPNTCPECAVDHPVEQPHNQQSLHWQYSFRKKHDRWPTWEDAMAHCSDEMKEIWKAGLRDHGVEI